MKTEIDDEIEDYCFDCGCMADDEVCPRCRAEIADAMRRDGLPHGDRRWNGQAMSRHRMSVVNLDDTVLIDIRENP
jgi:hypothetical protein